MYIKETWLDFVSDFAYVTAGVLICINYDRKHTVSVSSRVTKSFFFTLRMSKQSIPLHEESI